MHLQMCEERSRGLVNWVKRPSSYRLLVPEKVAMQEIINFVKLPISYNL